MPDTGYRTQILIAVIGLVGVLGTALISNWGKIFGDKDQLPSTAKPTAPNNDRTAKTQPYKPTKTPRMLGGRSVFRSTLVRPYDFDTGQELSGPDATADFSFKPSNPSDPNTEMVVVTFNGAKFVPRSPGKFPWEVPDSDFTKASGINSVPQGTEIACITSKGTYCTFYVKWELEPKPVRIFVSSAPYELR